MTQIKSIISVLFLMVCLITFGQTGTIKGQVYDTELQSGFAFASIMVMNKKGHILSASSDDDGSFMVDKIPFGVYSLRISFTGYFDTTFTEIKVLTDTILTIHLELPLPCKYGGNKDDKTCPKCAKEDRVIPIFYGLLVSTKGRNPLKNEGKKFKAGGCDFSYCNTHWYCKRDKIEF